MNKEKKKREPNKRTLELLGGVKNMIDHRRKTFSSAHLSIAAIGVLDLSPTAQTRLAVALVMVSLSLSISQVAMRYPVMVANAA